MTAENFCYFLQGYLETSNPELIGVTQTSLIKKKLEETMNPPSYASSRVPNTYTNNLGQTFITGTTFHC